MYENKTKNKEIMEGRVRTQTLLLPVKKAKNGVSFVV
jgi:hypothetical protein